MLPAGDSQQAARKIWLPDDDLRTETCPSSFSVLMCNFYISALVGVIINSTTCTV